MGRRICRFRVLPSKRSLPDTMYGLMVSAALFEALHCLKVPASPYTPPLLGTGPSPSVLLQQSDCPFALVLDGEIA
jgi:hypothetical protein